MLGAGVGTLFLLLFALVLLGLAASGIKNL